MRRVIASCGLIVTFASLCLAQQPSHGPRQVRARALEGLIRSRGEEAVRLFIEQQLAPAYRDSFPPGRLVTRLQELREAVGDFGGVLYGRVGEDALRVTFIGPASETAVLLRVEKEPPHRILELTLEGTKKAESGEEPPPYTWETLAARLEAEAKEGFSGTVLAVRGGQVVLHQGFGLADRERGVPNGTETIFAIGSVPIDFTRAAILKLEEVGKLKGSDPIGRFLGEVPQDKQAMTLDHLMRGASGLPDFHHLPGVDADPDLTWIDRATAIRRILAQPLLFPPGRGEAHSHSAWVLLAAIVEIASGQPYGEFLKERFFTPAGMTRTGLHEEGAAFPDDQFAVGYEGRPAGDRNIPKHWGRTSWLVMGSGGMQSTPMDLYRWLKGIRGGLLSPAMAARYFGGGVLAGGDQRGFLCVYTEGPDDLFILSSNAHRRPGDRASRVADRLVALVRGASRAPFLLGIRMRVEAEGGVFVQQVVPGGAAERDGLKEGDRLVSANGTALAAPEALRPLLQSGDPIAFEVERDGKRERITVRPLRAP